jgi:Family of unknown function (DUF6055)
MPNFNEICALLPRLLKTEHFEIRYGPYDAGHSAQGGYRGYRELGLVEAYADGLETGFNMLQRDIFKETKPLCPIRVAIFHLPDYPSGQGNRPATLPTCGPSRIILSNRSCEITEEARVDRAKTEAVHEVCHVFQFDRRPPRFDLRGSSWDWITEATAAYCEQFVYPRGKEGCFYCQDWLDSPEVSLDVQGYSSSMFMRWLDRRSRTYSIGQIWENAEQADRPLDVVERLTGHSTEELFTDYARDAYFLRDPDSHCFLPEVHSLWGSREIRKDFILPKDSGQQFKGTINHLAAMYFAVRIDTTVSVMESLLECKLESEVLRAQIVVVKPDLHRGVSTEMMGSNPGILSGKINSYGTDVDHFVVVVSNGSRHLDGVPFILTVQQGSSLSLESRLTN